MYPVAQAEFVQHMTEMRLNGCLRYHEYARYLRVGTTLDDQVQHLTFAGREPGQPGRFPGGGRAPGGEFPEQPAGHRGGPRRAGPVLPLVEATLQRGARGRSVLVIS